MVKQVFNHKLKIRVLIFALSLSILNCNKEDDPNLDLNSQNQEDFIQIVGDKLKFDNKESLNSFITKKTETEFKNVIKNLKSKGFNSLRPVFDNENQAEIDEFLKRKKSKISKKNYLFSLKGVSDEVELDDDLISDNQFAGLLNENREIYVGDEYFVYTTKGLFFCKIEDEDYLKQYLINMQNSLTSKSSFVESKNTSTGGPISLAPIKGEVIEIDSKISNFRTVDTDSNDFLMYPDEDQGGGGYGGGSSSSATNPIPMLNAQDFGTCAYSENSLFQQIFGNTVKCNDYFDGKHRIQTKVYNENYLVFASIGVSAKFQKKRFIGWSESSLSEGVRLGINHAIYTYSTPFSPYNPFDPQKVVINYKGIGYDINGNVVSKFPINPTIWPYPQNETVGELDIQIFGNELYYKLTGKEANKSINQLLSLIRKNFKSLGGDKQELVNEMENDNIGINIVKFLPSKMKVVRADIVKSHGSQAKENFDTNFLLTLNNNTGVNFQTLTDQMNAKKYDNLDIDIYGAALKNGEWKGKRIIGKID